MTLRPNALVVGAGKAGSTSLHNYLDAHPAIAGSKVKELMYFANNYDRGLDWYLSNFPKRDGIEIYFESSPQYTFRDEWPETAKRIHDFKPDMKIIYIVREPLSRIISHFNHWTAAFPDRYQDLETALADPSQKKFFIDRSRYFYQISAYLDLFPPEQVEVVFLEDFKSNFVPTLNKIFRFLGVEEKAEAITPKAFNRNIQRSDARIWKLDEVLAERRHAIATALTGDIQALLRYCGKPADFWGNIYS